MSESRERMTNAPVVAVVLAAGFGTRFDPDNPKQLVSVGGKPIVCWSVEAFEANARVSDIVLVVNATVRAHVEQLVDEHGYPKVRAIIDGGAERADSTNAALSLLAEAGIPGDAKLLIHDAVRPFVSQASIDGCVDALDAFDAATVAIASTDTILLTRDADSDDNEMGGIEEGRFNDRQSGRKVIREVPDRPNSFRAQTPQAFRFDTIRRAYGQAAADPGFHPTDDTRVVVDYLPDVPVAIVEGSEENLKITTRADLPTAERIAAALTGEDAEPENDEAADGRITPMSKEQARARMHALLGMAASQLRH